MRTSTWKKWLAEFKKTDHYEKATATEITQFLFKYWWDIFDKAQENDEALAQECAVQLRHLAALMQRIERGEDVKKEKFDVQFFAKSPCCLLDAGLAEEF